MVEDFIPLRNTVLDIWNNLARQFSEEVFKLSSFDEERWAVDFATLQGELWPKFLQVGLMDMYYRDREMRQGKQIKLAPEEFEDLPATTMDNLGDYSMFENFLYASMHIEVARSLKFHLMRLVRDKVVGPDGPKREEDLSFLQDYCVREFLKREEHSIYQGLVEGLQMNQKWGDEQTDLYLERSIEGLQRELEQAEQAFRDHLQARSTSKQKRSKTQEP